MTEPRRRWVLASSNPGKLREFEALLSPHGVELVAQATLGVQDADEPHPSFFENALAKARHASRETGLPALADDSGLCVPALADAPGVHSARFAALHGGEKSDVANNGLLLQQLQGVADRRARFVAVLVLVDRPDDPHPLVAEGVWHGQILDTPRGEQGFGYDPLFWLPEIERTAAELEPSEKNRLSHRGQAMQRLLERLPHWAGPSR